MAFKMRTDLNALEASIENSTLHVYFFDEVIKSIPIPGLASTISMPRQFAQIDTTRRFVIGLLSNDKFRVILRVGGTCDLLTRDWVLLNRFQTAKLNEVGISIVSCGAFYVLGSVCPGYLAELPTGEVFMTVDHMPITILLDMTDSTTKEVYAWAKSHDDFSTLHISDNGTQGVALWANFGTKDNFRLNGFKTLKSPGFIGGAV